MSLTDQQMSERKFALGTFSRVTKFISSVVDPVLTEVRSLRELVQGISQRSGKDYTTSLETIGNKLDEISSRVEKATQKDEIRIKNLPDYTEVVKAVREIKFPETPKGELDTLNRQLARIEKAIAATKTSDVVIPPFPEFPKEISIKESDLWISALRDVRSELKKNQKEIVVPTPQVTVSSDLGPLKAAVFDLKEDLSKHLKKISQQKVPESISINNFPPYPVPQPVTKVAIRGGGGNDEATTRVLDEAIALNVSVVDGDGNQVTSFGGSGGGIAAYSDSSGTDRKGLVDGDRHVQVDVLTTPTITVTASDLDIRDLTSASDSISAVQSGSWSVIANAGTNLNTSALALESGGNLATIAGAVSGTEMQVDVISMPSVTVQATDLDIRDLSSATDSISAVQSGTWTLGANSGTDIGDVTINNGSGASAVNIQDGGNVITVDGTVGITANSSVNVNQLAGTTTAVNNGNVSNGTLRVTVAADSTGQIIARGPVAVDAAISTNNPVIMGGRASAAVPTAMSADNDVQATWLDRNGRQVVTLQASTSTLSNVSGSASSTTLLSSNTSRKGAMVFNDSTAILYLKLGATASSTSFTVKMRQDEYYEVPFGYTGVIDGIWASATGSARVTEIT